VVACHDQALVQRLETPEVRLELPRECLDVALAPERDQCRGLGIERIEFLERLEEDLAFRLGVERLEERELLVDGLERADRRAVLPGPCGKLHVDAERGIVAGHRERTGVQAERREPRLQRRDGGKVQACRRGQGLRPRPFPGRQHPGHGAARRDDTDALERRAGGRGLELTRIQFHDEPVGLQVGRPHRGRQGLVCCPQHVHGTQQQHGAHAVGVLHRPERHGGQRRREQRHGQQRERAQPHVTEVSRPLPAARASHAMRAEDSSEQVHL
jgi:hypothetical protein